MAKIKLPVYLISSNTHPDDFIAIGEGLLKKLKAPANLTITLKLGAVHREVRLIKSNQPSLRISSGLASRLGLSHGVKLCASFNRSSRILYLGPVIGVLVSRIYSNTPERPFGATTPFCLELAHACALHGGFVYFFTPNDIGSQWDTVSGIGLSGGRWVRRTYPSPDVLYNRLTSRKLENKEQVQRYMRDVKGRCGTVVFNEKYLDKTEVFQALRRSSSIQPYLPESHPLKNFAMLKGMCSRHNTVFLKPVTGSFGKGIIKIARSSHSSGYQCFQTGINGVRRQEYSSLLRLFQSISSKIKQRPYQIQQGLRLMETGGRPVDFRALVQRNQQGVWAVTSVVARIAANNTFVSNLARGGTLSPLADAVARSALPQGIKAGISSKLRTAALNIAQAVETHLQGHYAELGVDLAVDSAGKVWLLEVNSKPSKDDITPVGEGKIRPSVKQIVLYSQHAWGK